MPFQAQQGTRLLIRSLPPQQHSQDCRGGRQACSKCRCFNSRHWQLHSRQERQGSHAQG